MPLRRLDYRQSRESYAWKFKGLIDARFVGSGLSGAGFGIKGIIGAEFDSTME